MCQQIWKTQQWPQDWKRLVFIPIPKKDNAKECSNYLTVALISHASKVMPQILQATLQQYIDWELPNVQTGFRKGRGIRDQIANIRWVIEKAREFQKNIYFYFTDYAKAFDCVDHRKNVESSSRDGNTRPLYLLPEKSVCRSRSNGLVPNWERSTSRPYIVTLLHHVKCRAGWCTSWNQDCQEKYQ